MKIKANDLKSKQIGIFYKCWLLVKSLQRALCT